MTVTETSLYKFASDFRTEKQFSSRYSTKYWKVSTEQISAASSASTTVIYVCGSSPDERLLLLAQVIT